MKKPLLLLLILTIPLLGKTQNISSETNEKIALIESNLNDLTRQLTVPQTLQDEMSKLNVPGVSVAVIENYQISWIKSYGFSNVESNEILTPKHVFEVASNTKVFMSSVVLHMVEKGLIDLDTDINQYLKRWKLTPNEFTKNQKVTLRLLLTHQAGINRPASMYSYEEGSSPTLVDVLNGNLPAINDAAVVEFEPGSKWEYSNIAFNIIEMLLEDVSGKSLPELFEEIIFKPLGMKNSFLGYPLSKKFEKQFSVSHNQEGKVNGNAIHPSAYAHGGLITSPEDFSKFVIEMMLSYNGKSNKILSKETTQLMFTKVLDLDPSVLGGFAVSQGLGIFVRGDEEKDFAIMFAGNNGLGSNSMFYAFPNIGQAGIVQTNGAMGELLMLEIIDAIGTAYHWPDNRFSIK